MALFDLDGVLLRGDTMATLVISRLGRRPWRLPVAALLFVASTLVPSPLRRERLHRSILSLALRGDTDEDYEAAVAATASDLAARSADPTMIQKAATALHAARRVVIVTAAERRMAAAYLAAVGLAGCDLLASELSFTDGRAILRPHNVGEAKVVAVAVAGIDTAEAEFYTDSASDLPLISRCGRAVLVAPSRRTRAAVRRAGLELETIERVR